MKKFNLSEFLEKLEPQPAEARQMAAGQQQVQGSQSSSYINSQQHANSFQNRHENIHDYQNDVIRTQTENFTETILTSKKEKD